MPRNDADLVRRIRQHDDQQAFTELVMRYQSRLRYSLRQLTGFDEALADDLAQETFLKAYRNLHSFRADAQFYTWLYRIAWRCLADHYRRRKPDQYTSAEFDENLTEAVEPSNDLHLDFARVLMQFDPQQRMVLHLHLQREFTQAEIAAVLDCPLGTVKSHIQRGRAKLRDLLADWQT